MRTKSVATDEFDSKSDAIDCFGASKTGKSRLTGVLVRRVTSGLTRRSDGCSRKPSAFVDQPCE